MLYGIVKLVSRLPLAMLHPLADGAAFLLRYVVRYRRKVVRRNLTEAFPELSPREIRRIERKYYQFLGDYVAETVRLLSMPESEMRRRMKFEGLEQVNEDLRRGQCVSLFLGHYCNWEWVSSLPLHLEPSAHPCQIYHRMRNVPFEKLFLKIRSRFGATCVKMADAGLVVVGDYRRGTANVTGYIADQSPKYNSLHHFVPFLNHDTAVLTGTERLSRAVHASVYYLDMSRPRRGEYLCRVVKMTDDAASLPKFELTDMYWRMFEETVRREPAYWLWSHRRWKHTFEGLKERFPDDWEQRLKRL